MQFKSMWSDYEWENKINVSTSLEDVVDYVNYMKDQLNANLLTPLGESDSSAGFVVANLYVKSKFEEDSLINISIEKIQSSDSIKGLIRIRAKTEGMAGCIGNKIK